jgi:hypothetical protein
MIVLGHQRRQEDHEFKANLGYKGQLCLKRKKKSALRSFISDSPLKEP